MELGEPDFDAALLLEQMKTNPEAAKVAIESTTTRLAKEYCEVLNTAVHTTSALATTVSSSAAIVQPTTSALATTVSSSAAIVQPRIVPESEGTKVLDHSVAKVTQSATTVDPESEGTKVLDHSVTKVTQSATTVAQEDTPVSVIPLEAEGQPRFAPLDPKRVPSLTTRHAKLLALHVPSANAPSHAKPPASPAPEHPPSGPRGMPARVPRVTHAKPPSGKDVKTKVVTSQPNRLRSKESRRSALVLRYQLDIRAPRCHPA
jgi:hypothetical protein